MKFLKIYSLGASSGPVGSYFPSFTSIITVPLSCDRTICHCPRGMFNAATDPQTHDRLSILPEKSNLIF